MWVAKFCNVTRHNLLEKYLFFIELLHKLLEYTCVTSSPSRSFHHRRFSSVGNRNLETKVPLCIYYFSNLDCLGILLVLRWLDSFLKVRLVLQIQKQKLGLKIDPFFEDELIFTYVFELNNKKSLKFSATASYKTLCPRVFDSNLNFQTNFFREWFINTQYLESNSYKIFLHFLKNFFTYLIELGYTQRNFPFK